MISEALSSIRDVQWYPIITLVMFFTAFVGVVVWTLRLRKQEVARLSRLPLEDSMDYEDPGDMHNGQA